MEQSSIEIKLISAEDLRAFNFFHKLSVFALASVAADAPAKKLERSQQQRTPTDRHNNGFPEWNHVARFVLDSDADSDLDRLFVHLDLRHDGVLGDRTIGEVRIPVKDLADGGAVRFVRYQVKSSDGKPNGVLNLSYRFVWRNRKTLTLDPCNCLYPKVEEVPNLDLIDASLSCYSSRFNGGNRDFFWNCPPQTTSFQQTQNHHLFGYGEMWKRGDLGW